MISVAELEDVIDASLGLARYPTLNDYTEALRQIHAEAMRAEIVASRAGYGLSYRSSTAAASSLTGTATVLYGFEPSQEAANQIAIRDAQLGYDVEVNGRVFHFPQ